MRVLIASLCFQPLLGKIREIYTSNGMCVASKCINPIFPGLEDLHRLDGGVEWVCSELKQVSPNLGFCSQAVDYHSSIPKHNATKEGSLEEAIRLNEQTAITMYAYHLSAMGMEYWDYTDPASSSDHCIRSVWKLACYTYFPRAPKDCKKDDEVKYLRPCESSCHSYVRSCGVECCDESVKCVFEHSKRISADVKVVTKGYYPETGPSEHCTGAASRASPLWILLGLLLMHCNRRTTLLILLVGSLCMLPTVRGDIEGSHRIGNWRAHPDYLTKFKYVPPGGTSEDALLNSCSIPNLSHTLQCSGHGMCKAWDENDLNNTVMFCECDPGWADPECRTKRKSQAAAFSLALFLGFTGADMFYLDFPIAGSAKLCTLGGLGFWWIWDIISIGSSPVYSSNFRVADNLPHWVYVFSCVAAGCFVGFTCFISSTMQNIRARRKGAMMLMTDEEYSYQ